MANIITLGEIMLRLSTVSHKRFVQANTFDIQYGGSEANVAVSLAQFGHQSAFISKVPNNDIGQSAINHLRQFGVDTTHIHTGGNRLGIYFLETGASMRPSTVIYDRLHSAISEASSTEFNFDEIFKGCDWLHVSGITPALSSNAASLTKKALQMAQKNHVKVSLDLNYRKNLWTPEQAQKTMIPLMEYVDVCIGNEEDMSHILGYNLKETDVTKGQLHQHEYEAMLQQIQHDYKLDYVVSTLRTSINADHNMWCALLYDGTSFYNSNTYDINIVDRVGAGDSFSAALIHGLLTKDTQTALEFAVAASALKHTIHGDVNVITEDEVNQLLEGNTTGRVQR